MDLIEIGKLPIPGDNPVGYDVRSGDLYEQLFAEINKRVTVTANSGLTDWDRVVKLSQDILQNHSKDILVCSYFCVGLLNTRGLKGFATGLRVYYDLVDTYWANLYPPRINGRINAIDWWVNTVSDHFRKIKSEIWIESEVERLNHDFEALIKFFTDKEIEQAADIRGLQNACKRLATIKVDTPPPPPAPEPVQAEVENVPTIEEVAAAATETAVLSANTVPNLTTTQAAAKPNMVEIPSLPDTISLENITQVLEPAFNNLANIATLLNEQEPKLYMLYKINRFLAWLDIVSLPEADQEGKTTLAPPDKNIVTTIESLYKAQNWSELLKFAEANVVQFRFCLDLSYYVYTSLINLNQRGSATELAYEVFIFTKRLNGVEKLLFSDGTPFASTETAWWIASLEEQVASGGKRFGDDEKWQNDVEEAQKLAKNGDLSTALNKLHYRIQSAQTKRDRFLRILFFCQFVNSIKHGHLSKPYLEELLDSCDKYQLEIWEPTIVSQVYQLVLNVARQKTVKFEDDKINAVLNRLTVIDPSGALKFHVK